MRLVLSVNVGYRNCAKVLGRVTPRCDGSVHVEVLKAEVCDVLKGKKPTTVAATALKVVDHLLPWFESSTEVVCEAQVRKSGMNFGIAHAILGRHTLRAFRFRLWRQNESSRVSSSRLQSST